MTRINTNVSSLVARNTLGRSNGALQQSLTRLSTGLRINTGKDDPAGLIASENLRSDITSIKKAISNTDRANQVIATADSALGQVSSLLNDIRGLVTESANNGALSAAQIAANQLQIDSSLEALNRIAQTTTFQGRKLLDGSLDFITSTSDVDFANISTLKIDQANLGAAGTVPVNLNVTTAATKAQVDVASIPSAGSAATQATGNLVIAVQTAAATAATGNVSIDLVERQASGTVTIDSTNNATFTLTAKSGGDAAGAEGNGPKNIVIVDGTSEGAAYDANTDTLTVTIDITGGSDTVTHLASVINAGADFATSGVTSGSDTVTATNVGSGTLAGGRDTSTESISVTAVAGNNNISITLAEGTGIGATPTVSGNASSGYTITVDDSGSTDIADIAAAIQSITEVATATYSGSASYVGADDAPPSSGTTLSGGAAATTANQTIAITAVAGNNNISITLAESSGATAGTPVVTGNASSGYTVTVNNTGNTTIQQIRAAIAGIAEVATATYGGSATYNGTNDAPPSALTLSGGAAATSGGLADAVVFELAGSNGAEVLSFGVGTSLSQLVTGINLVKDATGVEATANGTTLELTSVGYGSKAVVDIRVITEGTGSSPSGVFTTAVGQRARDTGADIVANVNGIAATGSGNNLSINTATLDLSATVAAGFTGQIDFSIIGGGALFQLGPDVVSNQQARLGIGSVNAARLGGASGKLYELGAGGSADLSTDTTKAASIVTEAIDQVTTLRGRLGAFQRTLLETNKNALNDTLVNLTDAESQIRDADFAEESASLTRAQILVQSGTTVLQIANSNPQNVLALLR
jgi:flagellin